MSGKPEGNVSKQSICLEIDSKVSRHARELLEHPLSKVRSFSQLTELLLFWARSLYTECSSDRFAHMLRKVKAHRLLAHSDLTHAPKQHRLHMTIDPQAVRFLDSFCKQYPGLFRNRNEALELIVSYALMQYSVMSPEHFFARLEDIRLHNLIYRKK